MLFERENTIKSSGWFVIVKMQQQSSASMIVTVK